MSDDLPHPERPSWHCPHDGELWPCELARKQLAGLFHGDKERLATQLAWLMVAAARDLGLPEPSKLYRRFVWWAVVDRTPCGRCGKAGHRALSGLPPRLFPHCFVGRHP